MGEVQSENNLFYTCSLIEYIARKTNNKKSAVVDSLGRDNEEKIYELAEVYHSDDIEKVSDEFIKNCNIELENYDITKNCKYGVPTFWKIGRVYQRLILMIDSKEENYIDTLITVLSSWIIEKIDNYNSSMYYENSSYIYECYKEGKVL